MKSKLTANYKQKYSKREIQNAMTIFQRKLIENLEERLNIFEIQPKKFEVEPSSSDTFQTLMSRSISFNTATDDEIYYMVNNFDYWFRNQIVELEVSNNNGVFSMLDYILRDTEVSNNSSLRKKVIHIEMRYEGSDKEAKQEEILNLINTSILNASKEISKVVKGFTTPYKSRQKLHDFKTITYGKKKSVPMIINDMTSKEGFSQFKNMNENKDRRLYKSSYPIEMITTYWAKLEKSSHSIVKIGSRVPFKIIEEKSKNSKTDINDEMRFAVNMLNPEVKDGIYMEIDIYRSLMALLDLAHVTELQPDEWDNETNDYVKSHNIKTL